MPHTIQGVKSDGTYQTVKVDEQGSLTIGSYSPSIFTLQYDYVGAAYPNDTTEVYTTRIGGASGSIQEVATVTYTDNTKENLSSVARS